MPTTAVHSRTRPDSRPWLALLAAFSVLYLILTIRAARLETPTVDECAHLPAGCLYWKTGTFDLYSKNPPLVRLWMSLPVVLDREVRIPKQESVNYGWGPWEYGASFLNANRPRYLDLVFRARLMIIPLGLAAAWLLFRWGREIWSLPAAVMTTGLFLLCPTLLAHGHLATIDAGCTLTVLLAVLAIRRAARRPGLRAAALCGLALGVALSVKYTALLLLPILAILLPLHRLRGEVSRRIRVKGLLVDLLCVLVVAVLTVNLLMGFADSFRAVGDYTFDSAFMKNLQRALPQWLPAPLPGAYVKGFDAQKLDVEAGEFGSYLLGRWAQKGWWYYNLFAILVKEPESVILLLLLIPWCWRRRPARREEAWFLLVPAAVLFLSLSVLNTLNAGIRYLLPAYPFVFLLGGSVFEALRSSRFRRLTRLAPALLVGYSAGTAAAVNPGYISYFNLIAGGSGNGPKIMLDSNMDWGQDLYRVPQFLKSIPQAEQPRVLYFGNVDPTLYNISFSLIPAEPTRGVLFASVNFLFGFSYQTPLPDGTGLMVPPNHLSWLRGREPTAKLGSIWVFDTRRD